jgi:hypothetical protein
MSLALPLEVYWIVDLHRRRQWSDGRPRPSRTNLLWSMAATGVTDFLCVYVVNGFTRLPDGRGRPLLHWSA